MGGGKSKIDCKEEKLMAEDEPAAYVERGQERAALIARARKHALIMFIMRIVQLVFLGISLSLAVMLFVVYRTGPDAGGTVDLNACLHRHAFCHRYNAVDGATGMLLGLPLPNVTVFCGMTDAQVAALQLRSPCLPGSGIDVGLGITSSSLDGLSVARFVNGTVAFAAVNRLRELIEDPSITSIHLANIVQMSLICVTFALLFIDVVAFRMASSTKHRLDVDNNNAKTDREQLRATRALQRAWNPMMKKFKIHKVAGAFSVASIFVACLFAYGNLKILGKHVTLAWTLTACGKLYDEDGPFASSLGDIRYPNTSIPLGILVTLNVIFTISSYGLMTALNVPFWVEVHEVGHPEHQMGYNTLMIKPRSAGLNTTPRAARFTELGDGTPLVVPEEEEEEKGGLKYDQPPPPRSRYRQQLLQQQQSDTAPVAAAFGSRAPSRREQRNSRRRRRLEQDPDEGGYGNNNNNYYAALATTATSVVPAAAADTRTSTGSSSGFTYTFPARQQQNNNNRRGSKPAVASGRMPPVGELYPLLLLPEDDEHP